MKYPAYNHKLTLRGNLIELLGVNNTFSESQLFDRAAKQILKRDEAMQRIARACGKTFTVDIGYVDLPELVEELLARPDATQPQLSEIRYVLHGDIQPCSVLYSDDTTTLLRLDEGDMMLETDTIEWSDSVTYRCQELLKSAGAPGMVAQVRISTVLAQLVRDERILLNDNGDDGFPQQVIEQAPTALPWQCLECRNDVAPDLSMCPTCHTKVPRADAETQIAVGTVAEER
ncbi:hypothetical protein VPH234P10_0098 [Vibrio phage 234P10]|nr:hypothetical protein SIPHO062v1_p0040 [Vibrio phage PS17B.1]